MLTNIILIGPLSNCAHLLPLDLDLAQKPFFLFCVWTALTQQGPGPWLRLLGAKVVPRIIIIVVLVDLMEETRL